MFRLPKKIFNPGNIIGLGESSHGSSTESNWKHNLILDHIRSNKDKKIVFYLEAYEDPIHELLEKIKNNDSLIEVNIKSCLNKLYKIWQTQEIYNLLLSLAKLSMNDGVQIEIHGVDFRNPNEKKSMDQEKMLKSHSYIIFNNIKKHYCKDAIHFFSAHNMHVGKYVIEKQKDVGKFLIEEFGQKYVSIAQHTSRGLMRARNSNGIYEQVEFAFEKTHNSVTALADRIFKNKKSDEPVIIPTSDTLLKNTNLIEQAGFYWPLEEYWLMEINQEHFDYLTIHKKGEASQALIITSK
ncbi:MAG: hypothetical protein ACI9GH_000018 [Candidatus Paceibacteria bacterium]|jgi:hypothetical protein